MAACVRVLGGELVGRVVGTAACHGLDLGAFAQAVDAVDDHGLAGGHAVGDDSQVILHRAGLDRAHGDGVVFLDHIDEQPLAPRWMAAVGMTMAPCSVLSCRRILTNWLGNSA
jgi:hypothetical protein